jgi:magnesium chelatase family protein
MWIEVPLLSYEKLADKKQNETSSIYTKKIMAAQTLARRRYQAVGKSRSSDLSAKELENFVPLSEKVRTLLALSAEKLLLSARSYHKVIKVARTIADLEGSNEVKEAHLLEALQYRQKIN